MPALLQVRDMTEEERTKIQQLARSQKAAVRLARRAQIIRLSCDGWSVSEIVAEKNLSENSVRKWIKRFNEHGVTGLADAPRSGRPATYSSEQVSLVIEAALTKPDTLGLPFACWTLDRLEAYLNEQKGVDMKRSRIDELLIREGLRWRMQETWFSERVDPDFAQKRGPSSRSTPSHRPGAS
jgi:transposase